MSESTPPELRLADGRRVDLDAAWTPGAADAAIPIRPVARRVLARHDPFGEAMSLVDRLADQTGLHKALSADDVSVWPRRRLVAWRRLHDLILWRGIVAELGITPESILDPNDAPTALRDLLGLQVAPAEPDSGAGQPALLRRLVRRARRTVSPPPPPPPAASATDGPEAERDRLGAWFGHGRFPLLVLSDGAVHQTVDTPEGPQRQDPFLGPVVEQLRGSALNPVVVALDGNVGDGDRRVSIRAITAVPDLAEDQSAADAASAAAVEVLAPTTATVDLDGIDVGTLLLDAERAFAADGLGRWWLARARIERFLATHRPAGVLLINEYSRPEWLSAAHRQGIPVAAVQHGVIHRHHAGYMLPERPLDTPIAGRTYVFGEFERRLLTAGVYRDDEIRVSGAPRLDLLAASDAAIDPEEVDDVREATRAWLGARPGERLVVFSSTSNPEVRSLVVAPILEAILDRPLPNVRLVVKLHPAEAKNDVYERLVAGLAAAGGFEPPPVTVVGDIDLFGLLRAADAHLGIHSTVLTDAVVAGIRNLVVVGFPGSDLIDYVERGVATPIRNGSDLLAALEAPPPAPDDAARLAFLDDQLLAGNASQRIAADLSGWLGG